MIETPALPTSSEYHGQHYNNKDDGKNHQQTARLPPRTLLIPTRTSQLYICVLRIHCHILYVPAYRIELPSLLMHNMRHIPEQLVQLSDALLNIPDLRFPLHDQRVLEIYFVLRR